MRPSYKDRFVYDLPKYLGVILLSIFLWYFAFHLYHAPKDTETLNIFFAGNINDFSLSEQIESNIDGIESCSLSACLPEESAFESKYGVVGLNGSDILLLTEDVANNTAFSNTIVKLHSDFFNSYSVSYYERDGVVYGIYLPDSARLALSKYFSFESGPYVLLITDISIHSGDYSTYAYDAIAYLISLCEE